MPNNHEPEFRDRLYDYESPVDPEAIWQAVNAKLPPPKKRRKKWWWLPGLLLLLGSIGAFAWLSREEQPAPEDTPLTSIEQVATPENSSGKEPDPASSATLGARPQDAGEESLTATEVPSVAQTTVAPGALSSPSNKVLSSTASPSNTGATVQPDNNNTAINPAATNSDPIAQADAPRTERRPSGGSPTAELFSSQPAGTALLESASTTPETVPSAGANARQPEALADRQQRSFALDQLSWPSLDLYTGEPGPQTSPLSLAAPVFTSSRPAVWSLALETTVSRVSQAFTESAPFAGSESRLPFYEATLRPLEAISTDLLLGYQTPNNWTLRSGVGYTRINTVAEVNSVSVNDSLRGEGVVRVEIRAPGDTTFVMGTVNLTQTTTRTQRYYNNLTLLDIPLLIGRRFSFGKLDLNLEAGPVFNLTARASARLPISATTFSERTESENLYRTSIGVSWRGQATAGYRLTDKLSVYTGIDYRRLPQRGVETDNAPVTTRYSLIGGKVGLRYRF